MPPSALQTAEIPNPVLSPEAEPAADSALPEEGPPDTSSGDSGSDPLQGPPSSME